jgi:hypothetical protein
VLDTLTSDNSNGNQIIEWQDIAYALFPTTNATQISTIDTSFWTENLKLTFQGAGGNNYWTLMATTPQSTASSQYNFTLIQSDLYANALSGGATVTFTANSASAFLNAVSTAPLAATGLSATSLLEALDINSGGGKNVFQATINGQITNIFSYASANDSFNGTGSQWDVINNLPPRKNLWVAGLGGCG